MNKIELKQLENQLENLHSFVKEQKVKRTWDEIVKWVSECISVFSRLNVNEIIISKFIEMYSPEVLDSSLINGEEEMGTFKKSLYFSNKFSSYRDSYLVDVAFLTAKSILVRLEEDERLVPSWMLKELFNNKEYSNIYSSLELIEKNYEDRDGDGIIKNSASLLENILDLDVDLKKENNLSGKLKKLREDKEKLSWFGLNGEFVEALNNIRIVRNTGTHKVRPIKCDIPFLIAVNNANMIILLLEIFLSNKNKLIY